MISIRSIFKKEIPPIKQHTGGQVTGVGNDFEVAMTDLNHFREVEFCPNCLQYTKEDLYNHKC